MRRLLIVMTVLAIVAVAACSAADEAATTTVSTAAETTATTVVISTTTLPSDTTTTTSVAAEITARLAGVGFDEFVAESFDILLLRSPQYLTDLGIADWYGLRNDRMDDMSDEFIHETMAIESAVLDLIHTYDRESLGPDQQVTYDVYEWYLDDLVRGHPFVHHDYLLHHFIRSWHWNTSDFFTDTFPLETPENAEDYVACVAQVRRQADEVLEGLRIREELGIYPPDFIISMARSDMVNQLGMRSPDPARIDPTDLEAYTRFMEETADIPGLDPVNRDELLASLETVLRDSYIPAWVELIEYLRDLEAIAGSDAGVWKLPDGDAYYSYMLRKETSTDLSPEEIHQLGLAEVERVQGEMRVLFGTLGYPADESLAASMNRIITDGGTIDTRTGPAALIAAYEALLDGVDPVLDAFFGLQPSQDVEVIAEMSFGGGGGYYSLAALDGSRSGAFHTGAAPGMVARYRMPTILYHEAVPGHHFQITIAQELDLPLVRSAVVFNGYAEGWALYSEYLAKELGLYDDDPYGDAGRLHLELLRSVRLVTDTGIHSMGWTRGEARAYMTEAMGDGASAHEVDRYIVLPAQATGYKVGMIEMLRLRALAEAEMGEGFDISGFHDTVLGDGSVPLGVLERLVGEWIAGAGG